MSTLPGMPASPDDFSPAPTTPPSPMADPAGSSSGADDNNVTPLPEEILTQTGLDTFQPGDVVFAPAKFTLHGDGNKVTGFSVGGLGPVSDKAPHGETFTDLSAGGEADENGDPAPEDDEDVGGEAPSNDDNPENDDDDKKKETEMLGYRRPGKKSMAPGFASAKTLFGSNER